MLPEQLVSAYRQYKQDTNAVATWLASTARAHGFLLRTETQEPRGRLKGKARKQGPEPQRHVIAINDFVPLARYIAASEKPVISIPHSFCSTINRVITARRRFSTRLAKHSGSGYDDESDARHGYFVDILESVREILRPRTAKEATTASTASPADELRNIFAHLDLQEPSQEFLDAPAPERPAQPTEDKAYYEVELQTTDDEISTAMGMLIHDLAELRRAILRLWTDHLVHQKLDLAACAVATNTAFELARSLIEDVTPIFEAHCPNGAGCAQDRLYKEMCKTLRENQASSNLKLNETPTSEYLLGDYLSYNAYRILVTFPMCACKRICCPKSIHFNAPNTFGVYDSSVPWWAKSDEQRRSDDKVILSEIMAELTSVMAFQPSHLGGGELLQGTKEMKETRKPPFYLVFIAQVHLDIHHYIGKKVSQTVETARRQIRVMREDFDLEVAFYDSVKHKKISEFSENLEKLARVMQKHCLDHEGDYMHELKIWHAKRARIEIPESMQPDRLLLHSPIFGGLLLFKLRMYYFIHGIQTANETGSIKHTLLLYHALCRDALTDMGWTDIEGVYGLLRGGEFFVGSPPGNADEDLKNFRLQRGISVSAVAKQGSSKRRKNVLENSRAGPRDFRFGHELSMMFLRRYNHGEARMVWSLDDIGKASKALDSDIWKGVLGDAPSPTGENEAGPSTATGPGGSQVKNDSGSPTSILPTITKSIIILAHILHREAPKMTFPYLRLHRDCCNILRDVRKVCLPILTTNKHMGKPLSLSDKGDRCPYFVVEDIFAAASEFSCGPPDQRAMKAAATVVDEFLASADSNGVAAVTALEAMGFEYWCKVDKKDGGDDTDKDAEELMSAPKDDA